MLFKQLVLDAIAAGKVTLAFRRWRRPTVRAGGTLRTAIGVLAIDDVTTVALSQIGDADARKAGFASARDLLVDLGPADDRAVYRMAFRLAGPDSRIALRQASRFNSQDAEALRERLERLDRRSACPWTEAALRLIANRPEVPAAELARAAGRGRDAFKADVRKLKELGLTESLSVGYRLSPRGQAFLDLLKPRKPLPRP